MGWQDLLQAGEVNFVSPWVGGRSLRSGPRTWKIEGGLPPEHGWYVFATTTKKARFEGPAQPSPELLINIVKGYLVGDRLIPDGTRVDPDPAQIMSCSVKVHLIEPGLDRFARIVAGNTHEDGPLVYSGLDMPLGPEEEVLKAYLDEVASVDTIKGVTPALDAAFRFEVRRRIEAEQRRAELERIRREEEARRQEEERLRKLMEQLGDGAGRRNMARVDFSEAARSALAISGATYLDHRPMPQRGEFAIRFRLDGSRYECVCDGNLRIIDSGICLTDHATDISYDDLLTLESLPSVIREAIRANKLVVYRHVD